MKKLKPIVTGMILGIVAKLADFISGDSILMRIGLHNLLNNFNIFIFCICVIEIYSTSIRKAMLNCMTFMLSMILGYYLIQSLSFDYFPRRIFLMWLIVSLGSPLFCYIISLRRKDNFLFIFGTLTPLIIISKEIESSMGLFETLDLSLIYNVFFLIFLSVKLPIKNTQRIVTILFYCALLPFIHVLPSINRVISMIFSLSLL